MINFLNPNIGLFLHFLFFPHRISTKILAKSWYTIACSGPGGRRFCALPLELVEAKSSDSVLVGIGGFFVGGERVCVGCSLFKHTSYLDTQYDVGRYYLPFDKKERGEKELPCL